MKRRPFPREANQPSSVGDDERGLGTLSLSLSFSKTISETLLVDPLDRCSVGMCAFPSRGVRCTRGRGQGGGLCSFFVYVLSTWSPPAPLDGID